MPTYPVVAGNDPPFEGEYGKNEQGDWMVRRGNRWIIYPPVVQAAMKAAEAAALGADELKP